EAALEEVKEGMIVGIGTGSTVNHFIDLLADIRDRIEGTVASSEASRKRLENAGLPVLELNATGTLPLYVDGADEATENGSLIKGGGGALTREKIVATASSRFICIVDESKIVKVLGAFPLPVEVLPMARSFVARKLVALGGTPEYRMDFTTDNGNIILDVHNMDLTRPTEMEQQINNIPGVIANGIFSQRKADRIIVATTAGIRII
ncbi:MAG TPA: ribose 5-phosphate isomerase A, partial [Gammaproteobacteria bacterium]|nr:ribose 5-phosphate isomerase A [Gammaproteobacteria bacterium]